MSTRILSDLVAHAAALSRIEPAVLRGPGRARAVLVVRQAMVVVARGWGHSEDRIAAALGRDRSTINHALGVARRRLVRDPHFAGFVALLETACALAAPLQPPPPPAPDIPSGGARARNQLIGVRDGDPDAGHNFHLGMIKASRTLAARIAAARGMKQ